MAPILKKLIALNISVLISIIISIGKIILLIYLVNHQNKQQLFIKQAMLLDTKALTLLYNAIISPYLIYCVDVWGNTYKTNLYPLFIKQKKAIPIVYHAKYLDLTSRLVYKSRILSTRHSSL